ncbi:hypothetical protein JYK14_07025 [Siccirubricoccus sp. KC 17139]|uniref:Acyltransferase n=2 Tax=Siccirubricoccus soli TaxID=2899147 RepID=A0ABT1D1Y6_9PROT|nr:hypothetical protein [Siccirubricoccus soli]MCO6415929.1 hypothetical protein [Siccirubricoccus soli]MCP2682061.1 hypothetical protein [Siccirubricoccus soli]
MENSGKTQTSKAPRSLLEHIQARAPGLWKLFHETSEDSAIAAHILCQILFLYTDGNGRGYLPQAFSSLIEVKNNEVSGLDIRNPKARVFVGKNCRFDRFVVGGAGETYVFIGDDAALTACDIVGIGKKNVFMAGYSCRLEGLFTHIYGPYGFAALGPGMTSQHGCNFCIQEGTYVLVGGDAMLSTHVFVRTSDSHGIYDRSTGERINPARPVTLHPHVWISRATTVNKGTEIGEHSVVGQGAVVHGRLAPYSVYAGSPVQQVRSNVTWDRRTASALDDNYDPSLHHFLATFSKNAKRVVSVDEPPTLPGPLESISVDLARPQPARPLTAAGEGSVQTRWLQEYAAVKAEILARNAELSRS